MLRLRRLIVLVGLLGLLSNLASCGSTVGGKGGKDEQSSGGGDDPGTGGRSEGGAPDGGGSNTDGGSDGSGGRSNSGGTSGDSGGSGGSGTGGMDTGTGATGGAPSRVEHCEESDSDCTCDSSGCFLIAGADCSSGDECKTQSCGVTQGNASICCADTCDAQTQVCADDGSTCVTAAACEEDDERCSAEGNFQVCESGQWSTVEDCGGRGCNKSLTGGCLLPLGDSCQDNDECGDGTCKEAPDGSTVCCEVSCGNCQVCSYDGASCADPDQLKTGCSCTDTDTSNCDDNLDCTDEVCNDGMCSSQLRAGFCLIDNVCYSNGQSQPGNVCRRCDAASQNRAWSNSPSSVSCNDNQYCNGDDDYCSAGQCQHEFPTGNRCANVNGPCAVSGCDETRNSCFQPSSVVCQDEETVYCSSNSCGGDVMVDTSVRYCSGGNANCTGDLVEDTSTRRSCNNSQTCNASSETCPATLGCGNTWCDDSPGGLCWTLAEPTPRSLADATQYCDTLSLQGAGSGKWWLPSVQEFMDLSKGCDYRSDPGTARTASFQSNCVPDYTGVATCPTNCPEDGGPGVAGCYWPEEMGDCQHGFQTGYWTSSTLTGTTAGYWYHANSGWVVSLTNSMSHGVRCATDNPFN